ncbi:uncharacterized protein YegJ (DUF2314 family) [Pseudomonas sp. LP_7_YM]|nr:uncharacterized protein YegJ (DUF2314 family) [Pseudomonas sp. LP_7_YM]
MTDQTLYAVEGESEIFQEAVASAKATFKFFWRELSWERRRVVPGLDLAAVKVSFGVNTSDPLSPSVEHMWVTDVDFDGENLSGVLMSEPHWVKSLAAGDQVSVPFVDLNDWIYVLGGRAFGGFTVDALRSTMAPVERDEHDAAWGIDFAEAGVIELVPPARGQEPLMFTRGLDTPSDRHALAKLERIEHPMSLNVQDMIEQGLEDDPELISDYDQSGRLLLHREVLAGNHDFVYALLRRGADPQATDSYGRTSFSLAQLAGWPRVITVLETGEPAPQFADQSVGFPAWPIGVGLVVIALSALYFIYFRSWLNGYSPINSYFLGSVGFATCVWVVGQGLVLCTGPWYFRLRERTPMWGNARALDLICTVGGFTIATWAYDLLTRYFLGFH